ncbi:MAG: aspartate aminotransferase family protein [Anaerolineales bacterium]|jgi:glutamate/tyrosine decarboxylase-like PLP-dependent enzyme
MNTQSDMDDFADLDLSPQEFRTLGYQVIDMIADYYADVRHVPVFPPKTSAQVAEEFKEGLPGSGQDPAEVLDEWRTKVLPNATHLGSPRYFGFVNGSGTMIATLAEALAAAVNMNSGAWKPAPSATEIERRTIAWIAELIGYPTQCGGIFTSGGTVANFTALLTALRNTAPYDTTLEGLQRKGHQGRFTVYMSDHEGHVSITRVADLLNLGREAIRRVPSHDDFRMDVQALEGMLDEDIAAGEVPFCVVGQVGSINVGAIDPLEEIARVCQERGLWFHADGACGAVGAMLPEMRPLYKGLEQADSVTLDPHKWLYIPYECGCVLVKNPEKLRRAFSMTAPYLRGTLPTEYTGLDYFEYGPQMSRGFKALKVWMSLKHYGVEGYQRLLRQNVECAKHLDRLVRGSEDFEALHDPTLFIYAFCYAPKDLRSTAGESVEREGEINAYLDRVNQRIADEIQLSGLAFIMSSKVNGRTVLRLSICSHRTTLEDIDIVFAKLKELGEGLLAEEIGP